MVQSPALRRLTHPRSAPPARRPPPSSRQVALPTDPYALFSDSVTAAGVLTHLESVEAGLGLPHGTLHNPGGRQEGLGAGGGG